ncbi:regulator of chromosome condensation, RCC1 [Bifidobacterium actinocoloniiforme DSM 22766]|uniref:Regulator of chromosome condensation, RCC1 n=1 Tax=Bifidobacterium actinocoloniiforme DSM 22766 TaxID=1437605 RepID=A0A086YYU5_9BIFI|nr:regulator of chromosome condensation, RCC1 [Bifidobacterium actinocoloniiforme DSM 22766]
MRADETSNHFRLSPKSGPAAGGTRATINPYTIGGVKFTTISSGYYHTLALGDDGNAYAWGDNQYGQLGDDTNTQRLAPVRIQTPAGIKFTEISAGFYGHSIALGTDGYIYTWGLNNRGQSGLGDTNNRLIPTKIQPLPAGVNRFTQINAGADFNLAIGDNGKVYAWGCNDTSINNVSGGGQLGVGDTVMRSSPTLVAGIPGTVRIISISAAAYFSMALGDNGVIYTWGDNEYGQLGTGDTTNRTSAFPVNPPNGLRWTSITAGGYTAFATTNDGNNYAWGANRIGGQYGDGTSTYPSEPTAEKHTPTLVTLRMPAGVHIVQRSSNGWHTLVIGSDHKTYAWGSNYYTELGNNSSENVTTPVTVQVPVGVTFVSVTAGYWNSFAIGSDGNTYSWGLGELANLGDGSTTNSSTPVRVGGPIRITRVTFGGIATPGTVTDVSSIWTGNTPPHAPGDVDVVVSWTLNEVAQPNETLKYHYLDTFTVSFNLGAAPGSTPSPQHVEENSKAAWPTQPSWNGHRFVGWFLDNKPYTFNEPVTSNITLTARWEKPAFTFTMDPNRGPNSGGTSVTITPHPATSSVQFTQVSAGWYHTLAIGSDGDLYAWGENDAGQLGDNSITSRLQPTKAVTPNGVKFLKVSAGPNNSFALGSDNRWYAWGFNTSGQLGLGTTNNQLQPLPISMPAGVGAYRQVSPGVDHTLAIGDNGTTYAWGANNSGQLGDNTTINQLSPVAVQMPAGVYQFTQVSAAAGHSIGIGDNGQAYSWGSNQFGQLGTSVINVGGSSAVPVQVQLPVGVSTFKQATATADWSLAISDTGRIYTWGYNNDYELGNGTTTNQQLPAEPTLPAGITFTSVTTSSDSAMSIASNGSIYAWGDNASGQLGTGSQTTPTRPIVVNPKPGTTFAKLLSGWKHTIGVDTTGGVWTWGDNQYGQLGDKQGGPGKISLTPVSTGMFYNINITAVKFGTAPAQSGPTPNDGASTWNVTSPRYDSGGPVPVIVTWTLDGVAQTDYPIHDFTYIYIPYTLPRAGSIPFHGLIGTTFIAFTCLAGVTLAGYQLSKARKQRQSPHTLRLHHTQP